MGRRADPDQRSHAEQYMASWWVSLSHKISYQLCYLKNYLEFMKIFKNFNYNNLSDEGLTQKVFYYVIINCHMTNAPTKVSRWVLWKSQSEKTLLWLRRCNFYPETGHRPTSIMDQNWTIWIWTIWKWTQIFRNSGRSVIL